MSRLFDALQAGDIALATRLVTAPLTRNRASLGQVPNRLMREYCAQRADPFSGAALIITEATQISAMGQGYLDTPGIHSAEQVAGWRRITGAVHARGARIVVQLWHVGRISHTSLLPGGAAPVSSTARGVTRPTSRAALPSARRRARWPPMRSRPSSNRTARRRDMRWPLAHPALDATIA